MAKSKKGLSRRAFLALSGGTGAGLMVNQGEKYVHKLIPYINQPDYPKPGEWAFLPTACRECPAGCGMLLWHRDGRATKAEGHPKHPLNSGKLCIRGQSSVQGEYDPDRLREVRVKNADGEFEKSTWDKAYASMAEMMQGNAKVALISDVQTGSLASVMEEFAAQKNTEPLYFELFNYQSLRKANDEMYGVNHIPRFDISGSDLIVSFGADFLETWLSPVEYAREFSEIKSLNGNVGKMIYVGASQTMTAVNADEFIVITPGEEVSVILKTIKKLHDTGKIDATPYLDVLNAPPGAEQDADEIAQKLADYLSIASSPIVLTGQPADKSLQGTNTAKAVNMLNDLLGNQRRIDFNQYHALSKTAYHEEVMRFFEALSPDHTLIIHHSNPVYSLAGVAEHIQRAGKVIYLGTMHNETAAYADWILPLHYSLESWGDYEAWKGTVSLMQPTMAPLYDTMDAGDIFLWLNQFDLSKTFKEEVRKNWRNWDTESALVEEEAKDFPGEIEHDPFFRQLMQKGYINIGKGAAIFPIQELHFTFQPATVPGESGMFLQLVPSLFFYDGQLANRPWLQEIPHPVSNIVWQSWVDMHPETARKAGIEEHEIVKLHHGEASLEVPVHFSTGIAKNVVALETGKGHWSFGEVANSVGVNVFPLYHSTDEEALPMVMIDKTGNVEKPVYLHPTMEQHDRELLRHVQLKELQNNAVQQDEITWPLPEGYNKSKDLYKPHKHEDHRWAMVIDLNSCIGCKACESACYAENNIPTLGKKDMQEGREMSWLKVVPYKVTPTKISYIPLPCQHCDAAPCEPVCPVYASVHTEEGLNAQIYNRCIGTRYCSNNCPYKVRRFNWKNYDRSFPTTLQLNPEVTVRERGVMEKCTFCVQRIRNKQYKAKKENRDINDGEIVPACAQTCPTNAITFGDMLDKKSNVYSLMQDERRYQLLHELNTKPAVVYLKKVLNES